MISKLPQTSGQSFSTNFRVDTEQYKVTSHYLYGDPSSTNATFDDLAPILVGAFAFFLGASNFRYFISERANLRDAGENVSHSCETN